MAGAVTAAAGERPASPQADFQVRAGGGRLSIDAREVPLAAVLERIARDEGFYLQIDAQAGASTGSWLFQEVPLEEGLSRLVRPYSLLLFFEPDRGRRDPPRISALYVLPAVPLSAAAAPARSAPEDAPERRLIELILGEADLSTRRQALADLAALESPAAEQALSAVIGVREAELRREVVTVLGQKGGNERLLVLGQAALGDPDAGVRLAAIEALAGAGGEPARHFLRQALKDRDETVRQGAARLLGTTESGH